jgi:IS5 family transposase
MRTNNSSYFNLFESKNLLDDLDQAQGLIILAKAINWEKLESELSYLNDKMINTPALSIRMMVALEILKYIECLSDEKIIQKCTENPYYQAFIGKNSFSTVKPCDSLAMANFRKLIGQKEAEIILKDSININSDLKPGKLEKKIIVV